MKKPRLVIPLTIHFAVRYILRTGLLDQIAKFAVPVIVLGWNDQELRRELKQKGVEVHQLPQVTQTRKYQKIREMITLQHFDNIDSPSTQIDKRRQNAASNFESRLRRRLKNQAMRLQISTVWSIDKLLDLEDRLIESDTNYSEYKKFVEKLRPDALFCVTPFLIEEEFLARACKDVGAKLITAILSFDNITTRGRIPVEFDIYLLWNKRNMLELNRIYPFTRQKTVKIVGAPQFDFYYDPSYIWDEVKWKSVLGIPHGRNVILFAAGPEAIAPLEPQWLERLDFAIDRQEISGNPLVLLRRHPIDPTDRWKTLRARSRNIIFDEAWKNEKSALGRTNITRWDIEKLASTLKYCSIHISTSSTMAIDGAILNKPQIGFAFDDSPDKRFDQAMKELYLREHYLPITHSGGLKIAYRWEEAVQMINLATESPELDADGRKRLVKELCTYKDGGATRRVADSIREFLADRTI